MSQMKITGFRLQGVGTKPEGRAVSQITLGSQKPEARDLFPPVLAFLIHVLDRGLVDHQIGRTVAVHFRQLLSYHSMTPWISSPSRSTMTIGVLACICF